MFSKSDFNRSLYIALLLLVILSLSACRNETQNQIRRSLQDFTADKMYITIYSIDGTEIFNSTVDGKVTRSNASDGESGSYVYWFDDKGKYHQTNLPYLITSYDRHKTP